MCGRIGLGKPERSDWLDGLLTGLLHEPRYNVKPTQDVPLIRLNEEGQAVAEFARWGLVPSWAKVLPKVALFNARGETVVTLPSFRNAFKKRRALFVTDWFYEWQDVGTKHKQPYLIERADGDSLVFAALWEYAHDGFPISTTIITIAPNVLMSRIHNRMPVVLEPEDWPRWLDPRTPIDDVQQLIAPAADGVLQVRPVSRAVSTGVDSLDCIAPFELT